MGWPEGGTVVIVSGGTAWWVAVHLVLLVLGLLGLGIAIWWGGKRA